MSNERRQDERLPVLWEGRVVTEDGEEHACEIRDVSLAGTLITSEAPMPLGKELILRVDGLGDYAGVVRWRGDSRLGLALMVGPDMTLKKFAEKAGENLSTEPAEPDQ